MAKKYKEVEKALSEVAEGEFIYSVAQKYCPKNPGQFISKMAKYAKKENSKLEKGLDTLISIS